jgi:hypothetical protein
MSEEDLIYFQRRVDEERVAAERAPDIVAARIHQQLAATYAALLEDKSKDRAETATG